MTTHNAQGPDPRTIEIAGNIFELAPVPTDFRRDSLLERYWPLHPRYQFFKGVPPGARFLDIGAGSGGLSFWKEWGMPQRSDIQMYGVDLTVGKHAERYVEFHAINLDIDALPFKDGFFDIVYASHLIEHVDHLKLFAEARRVSKPGALMFLETPTPESKSAPSCDAFIGSGYEASTLNFYDDSTHIDTLSLRYLKQTLGRFGFTVEHSGIIRFEALEPELLSIGLQLHDKEILTFGLWSRFQFAEYVVARRVSQ